MTKIQRACVRENRGSTHAFSAISIPPALTSTLSFLSIFQHISEYFMVEAAETESRPSYTSGGKAVSVKAAWAAVKVAHACLRGAPAFGLHLFSSEGEQLRRTDIQRGSERTGGLLISQ